MQRGKINVVRNTAIYLSRKLRRDILREAGLQFGIENESTVSSVIERVGMKLENDRGFSRRLNKIEKTIQTS
jgi:chromosomal replication initiation ATPase DnaA